MTVQELIEQLKKLPPDADVLVYNHDDSGWQHCDELQLMAEGATRAPVGSVLLTSSDEQDGHYFQSMGGKPGRWYKV